MCKRDYKLQESEAVYGHRPTEVVVLVPLLLLLLLLNDHRPGVISTNVDLLFRLIGYKAALNPVMQNIAKVTTDLRAEFCLPKSYRKFSNKSQPKISISTKL